MKVFLPVVAIASAFLDARHSSTHAPLTREPYRMTTGVPGRVTTMSGRTVWPAGSHVTLRGPVLVAADAELAIEAGVVVEAMDGSSLIVARNARLSVSGSQNEPVVLTCANNAKVPGCWDGLTIFGNAPINHGTLTSPAGGRGGAGGCRESTLDGALYGGCAADDSSGVLQYVRIQYATNGLRVFGIGSKSILRNVQVHRSTGHGLEVVGGTAQFRHLALTTNSQYGLVYSGGWTGQAQYVVIQQDATGYAGGLLGRNAVGAGGDQNAAPRSAPVLANFTIVTPPSDPGNPYANAAPAAVRFDRGAAGKLYNLLLIQPGIGVDVDDAATCTQLAAGALSMQGVGITAPAAATDPDVDPAGCATQGEASLLTGATTVTGVAATAQLQSATNVVLPDLRPVANSVIATAVGVAPAATGLLEAVTFLGALRSATSGVIPWYSGWTLGESLAAPTLVALEGVVSAPGRGGVAGVVVQVAPVGLTATTNSLGRFVVSGVPAGPVEVSFVSGVPVDCQTPAVVRAVASGGTTTLADAVLNCGVTIASLAQQSIVAGYLGTCGLSTAGDAYCWGENAIGSVGDGTTTNRLTPTAVSGGLKFKSLVAGYRYFCGLTDAGAAYCWGYNFSGAFGNGTEGTAFTPNSSPVPAGGGLPFAVLSAGYFHTCGLTSAGTAYCWGANSDGQLGSGGGQVTKLLVPTAVSGGRIFVGLTAGQYHTCGLSSDGTAYCWGKNSNGQLGSANGNSQYSPTPVSGGQTFVRLGAGQLHTCGLTRTGTAYCWGNNTYGQVGIGSTSATVSTPSPVNGGLSFTSFSTGSFHSCALTSLGLAYCWGYNTQGEIGDGSTTFPTSQTEPRAVLGVPTFASISAGQQFTCALTGAGKPYCWGYDQGGNLGSGAYGQRQQLPGRVGGQQSFTDIAAGSSFSCARTPSATAYCWGANNVGQLGDGSTTDRQLPGAVVGNIAFQTISVGSQHSCGLTNFGVAYCWGRNYNGALGDGTNVSRSSPTLVNTNYTFDAISVGGGHTCGITTTGFVTVCWGDNTSGQLGDRTNTARFTPVPVLDVPPFGFFALASGGAHTCALSTGGVYCWGDNTSGQLGNQFGSTSRATPVFPAVILDKIVAGGSHTCGITGIGDAYCWGNNRYGQVGDGTNTLRREPTRVVGGVGYTGITTSSSGSHTCALKVEATAYCWGQNVYAQLGDGTAVDNVNTPTLVGSSLGFAFTQISAGALNTCGVRLGGVSYCWGYGPLGLGLAQIREVLGSITFRVP